MDITGQISMTEPVSGAAGGAVIAKWLWLPLAKLFGVSAAALIGALLVAAFDPAEAVPDPVKRRKLLFAQYTAGLTVAWMFTPATTRWIDHVADWFNPVTVWDWLEVALPVGFLYGGLAIGLIGALVRLRVLIRDRGATALAGRLGMETKDEAEAGSN